MKKERKFFWDVDETLIHTETRPFPENTHGFALEDSEYFTAIRPEAMKAIEFTREVFGAENVFILSTATRDYLLEINRLGGWGFAEDHILSRKDLHDNSFHLPTAYGSSTQETLPHKVLAHESNLLVDNLPVRGNGMKVNFLGIAKTFKTNYLQVPDYYGVNFPNNGFLESIEEFIKNANREASPHQSHE